MVERECLGIRAHGGGGDGECVCVQAYRYNKRPRGRLQPRGKGLQEAIDPGQADPRVLSRSLEPQPELAIPLSGTSLRVLEAGGCRTPQRVSLHQGGAHLHAHPPLTPAGAAAHFPWGSRPFRASCPSAQPFPCSQAHHGPGRPSAVDQQMPTHRPAHLCCCGGSPGGGHQPSAPGHRYPEVNPEVEAVAPGGQAASEVRSVSCGKEG